MSVNDTTTLPEGWRIAAWPADWDPKEGPPSFTTVNVGWGVTLPERVTMGIQTPEMLKTMRDGGEAEVIAVILRAVPGTTEKPGGLRVQGIYGAGASWIARLEDVIKRFSPSVWEVTAQRLISLFLSTLLAGEPDRSSSELAAAAPRQETATASAGGAFGEGMQRRRKITPDHLREVAKVYERAQEEDEPPTRAVQHHFDVSHSTAAKWIGSARKEGLLPPFAG